MIVLSTGWNAPTKARCLSSVAGQVGVEGVRHVYIEASEQSPPRTALENTADVIRGLPADEVVALLDGDDWLATDRALSIVQRVYRDQPHVLMTYGSFIHHDGRPGFAAPYLPGENVRASPFRASHLKTFRAKLFQHIEPDDLMLEHGRDHSLMFPMLEMAGFDRAVFIPDIIYVYNFATSFEFSADRAGLMAEAAAVQAIRRRAKYRRLP